MISRQVSTDDSGTNVQNPDRGMTPDWTSVSMDQRNTGEIPVAMHFNAGNPANAQALARKSAKKGRTDKRLSNG